MYSNVIQIIDICPEGITEPLFGKLANGDDVVIKYPHNRYGTDVLFNEFLCGEIAKLIGVPVPEFGLCYLSEEIIYNSQIDEISANNCGVCFYSKRLLETAVISRGQLINVISFPIEKLIIFDFIINNHDRHTGNLLIDISKSFEVKVIDQSHVLLAKDNVKAGSMESLYRSNKMVYDLLSFRFPVSEESFVKEAHYAIDNLTDQAISEIMNKIPNDWIISIGYDKINKSLSLLKDNLKTLDSKLDSLAKEVIEYGVNS